MIAATPEDASPSPGKLSEGIREALLTIDELLKSSGLAMKEFQSGWEVILESYERDADEMERLLARYPPSYEEYIQRRLEARKKSRNNSNSTATGGGRRRNRKKRSRAATGPNLGAIYGGGGGDGGNGTATAAAENDAMDRSAHHALNFHLTDQAEGGSDDIFFLPPENDDDDGTIISGASPKGISRTRDDASVASSSTRSPGGRGCRSKKSPDRVRFDSRETMFRKMEEMRESESRLERRLFGDDSEGITERERKELGAALERCRSRNSKQVASMISKYRPKFQPSSSSSDRQRQQQGDDDNGDGNGNGGSPERRIERLGLSIPSLEEMMDEVNATVEAEQRDSSNEDDNGERGGDDADADDSVDEEMPSSADATEEATAIPMIPTLRRHVSDVRNEPIMEEEIPEEEEGDQTSPEPDDRPNGGRTAPITIPAAAAPPSLLRDSEDGRPSSEAMVCGDMEHFTPIQHLPLTAPEGTPSRQGGAREEEGVVSADGHRDDDDARGVATGGTSLRSLVQSHTQPVKIGPPRKDVPGTQNGASSSSSSTNNRPQGHLSVGGAGHTVKPLAALDAQIRKDLDTASVIGRENVSSQKPSELTTNTEQPAPETEAEQEGRSSESPAPGSADAPTSSPSSSVESLVDDDSMTEDEDYGSDDFDEFDDESFEDE